MNRRPGRAKMCNWLAARLAGLTPIVPFNPADLRALTTRAYLVDKQAPRLAAIAAELGWHADSDLDRAWQLIQRYDAEFYPADPSPSSAESAPDQAGSTGIQDQTNGSE